MLTFYEVLANRIPGKALVEYTKEGKVVSFMGRVRQFDASKKQLDEYISIYFGEAAQVFSERFPKDYLAKHFLKEVSGK